jgi:uncharacterized membrane protein YagU involved in acid resistance
MIRPIAMATAVAGTLDILFAMSLTILFGRQIGDMLRYVASGPFPQATEMGAGGAILGLLVHFALMAIMAAAYVWFADSSRREHLVAMPIRAGVAYGVVTYVIMNLIVVPLRFGTPLPPSTRSIVTQLFAHIVLVGIPIALITARHLRSRLS